MSTSHIEIGDELVVKRVCHGKDNRPMSYHTCSDKACEQCQGSGWYLVTVYWEDIVSAIKGEITDTGFSATIIWTAPKDGDTDGS